MESNTVYNNYATCITLKVRWILQRIANTNGDEDSDGVQKRVRKVIKPNIRCVDGRMRGIRKE